MCYLSAKGNAVGNFKIGLKHEVWGIPEKFSHNTQIKKIKKGDLIAFVGPGKNFTGRVSITDWVKKSFKGYFERISVHRITSDYSDANREKIWDTKKNSDKEEELYTQRFNFDRVPIFVMKNCRINKLGLTTKEELHILVYTNIRSCDPASLVDILHNSEKLNLEESKKELEMISEIIND